MLYNAYVNDFRDWLREQMRIRDWKQAGVAKDVGVSQSAVSQWLSGEDNPRPGALGKLAEITSTNPVWLFELVGYFPTGTTEPRPLRPLESAIARELQDLDEMALSMLYDQIRHVFGPRFRKRKGGEVDSGDGALGETVSPDHGDGQAA